MQWLTVAYAMTAAACLTLAAVHLQVWSRQRARLAHLALAVAATSFAALALIELWMVRAQTPAQFGSALRWVHLPGTIGVVSLVWFLWLYFGTGRLWLAWAACGVRLVALVLNFAFSPNLNYQTITSVKQVALFGGEHVSSAVGQVSRLVLIGQLSNLLLLLYILDVTVRLWRRGGDNDRRRAAVVGGSLLFFVLAAGVGIALVMAGILALPFFLSFPFLMMVLAMSYELSLDVVRAGQLSVDVHRLAAIVASSDDAILGKNLDGTITTWNAGAAKMYGYSTGEVIGQHVSMLAPAELRSEVPHILEQISRGEKVQRLETVRVTKDGRRIDVSLTISPITDERGMVVGASTIARDITARKRDERALHNLSGRLMILQDAERQRIAAELHDGLGQSLAIIKNRAAIGLRDQTPHDHVLEQLAEIQATAMSAILEVRQIAHNLRPYELDRLGLVAAIDSMVERISDSSAIALSADLDPITGVLSADAETSVYRIVQEGLNNVIKHSHAAAARVEIKKRGTQLIISVHDNGNGLPVPAQTGNGNNTTGVGLSGIAERVRTLNGTLAIHSLPARGTTLTICLEIPRGGGE
jgi:two-component system sensor histidine kinase UhpB